MLSGSRHLGFIARSCQAVLALSSPVLEIVPSTMSCQRLVTVGASVAVADDAYRWTTVAVGGLPADTRVSNATYHRARFEG